MANTTTSGENDGAPAVGTDLVRIARSGSNFRLTLANIASYIASALGISGTNTGDQTITLTGNVTGSGTGSFAATISNDAVTYAKMQNVSAVSKLLGRGSAAGVGDPEEITLGTNLSMSGTTLNASGGGGGGSPAGPDGAVQYNSTPGGSFTGTIDLIWDAINQFLRMGLPSFGNVSITGSDGDAVDMQGVGFALEGGQPFDDGSTPVDGADVSLSPSDGIYGGTNGVAKIKTADTDPDQMNAVYNNFGMVAKSRGGQMSWPDPNVTNIPFMPSPGILWQKGKISPGSGTTVVVDGMTSTSTGTISHPALATTSIQTRNGRTRRTSTATAGNVAGCRGDYAMLSVSSTADVGGFRFEVQFTQTVDTTGFQAFFGICASTAVLGGNPSALTNMVGVGYDSTDAAGTNWFLMNNDGSGTATRTGLGSTFLRNTTHAYRLVISWAPGSIDPSYFIMNMNTGDVVSGTISSDRPATGNFLSWKCEHRNGAIASSTINDMYSVTIDVPLN